MHFARSVGRVRHNINVRHLPNNVALALTFLIKCSNRAMLVYTKYKQCQLMWDIIRNIPMPSGFYTPILAKEKVSLSDNSANPLRRRPGLLDIARSGSWDWMKNSIKTTSQQTRLTCPIDASTKHVIVNYQFVHALK